VKPCPLVDRNLQAAIGFRPALPRTRVADACFWTCLQRLPTSEDLLRGDLVGNPTGDVRAQERHVIPILSEEALGVAARSGHQVGSVHIHGRYDYAGTPADRALAIAPVPAQMPQVGSCRAVRSRPIPCRRISSRPSAQADQTHAAATIMRSRWRSQCRSDSLLHRKLCDLPQKLAFDAFRCSADGRLCSTRKTRQARQPPPPIRPAPASD